jgi:hypothetical protein
MIVSLLLFPVPNLIVQRSSMMVSLLLEPLPNLISVVSFAGGFAMRRWSPHGDRRASES